MSNSTVGNIYSKIVDDVVHSVRESFDEYAPQPNVLEDFKREWQKKISQRKVAQMPWDPPPAPATSTPNAVPPTRPQPYTAPSVAASQTDTKIKVEPGTSYDLQNLASTQPTAYSSSNAPIALANASNELREKFGDKANDSIQKLNQDLGTAPHGQKRSLPAESPKQEHPDSKRRVTEYDSSLQAQSNQRIQELTNAQRKATISAAQTDGASEWRALVAARTSISAEDMKAADESIMNLARAQWKADEGNGLMEPFKNKPAASRAHMNANNRQQAPTGQVDGGDDDDDDIKEEADDAINSDLDDDEDDDVESGEDDDPQQLIVCTYERVARVKNKWKCTLKDGILITGGQEYVFAKATGEFEW